MRLTSVELENFKAFEDATLEITPLTILIGPNNAGKSTILQALALLAQSSMSGAQSITPTHSSVDLGRDALALSHLSRSGWTLGVGWDEYPSEADSAGQPQSTRINFLAQLSATGELHTRARVHLHGPWGYGVEVSAGWPPSQLPTIDAPELGGIQPLSYSSAVPWSITLRCPSADQDLAGASQGEPTAVVASSCKLAQPYLQELPLALQSFRYVGPDRAVDASVVALGPQSSDNPRSAADVVNTLAYDKTLLSAVSERCARIFNYGIDVDLIPDRQVALVATGPGNFRANLVNVGSGLVQLIWIILQLELALRWQQTSQGKYVATVGIEEPELHLHPAKQPDVARILADHVQQGSQVMCTTQSEHLLMAILQMVLDGSLDPASVSVYYVEEGRARRLTVDDQGRLSEGLRGFFEANEEQLNRHIDLLMRRA